MRYGKQVKEYDATELSKQLGERIRKDYGEKSLRELAESLASLGQLSPVLLDKTDDGLTLLTGGRRIAAVLFLAAQDPPRSIRGLEPGKILGVRMDKLTPYERLLAEFDENKHRKGFSNAEEALAIAGLKTAYEEEMKKGITTKELSEVLNYSKGQIVMALRVADAAKEGKIDPKKESSIVGAYSKLRSTEKIAELIKRVDEQEDKVASKAELSEKLTVADASEWITTVPDESIDFVHYDPPWGIGIDKYDRNTHYGVFDDSAELGINLAKQLIPELFRVMKPDTYGVAWFGIQYYQPLAELLTDAGFIVNPVPFIWYKTNKSGAQNDPHRTTLNVYEPFFQFAKGAPRMFKKAQTNVLSYPMPPNRVHFAQKNEDLLVDILERFTYGTMTIMDPTFGSGAVFVAAERLGRQYVGCEKDRDNWEKAIKYIRSRRAAQ